MAKGKARQKDYTRKRGHKDAIGLRIKSITFSWTKLVLTQGQSVNEWEADGLLADFCTRMRQIGQFNKVEALAQQYIKQYTQVGFPPDSKFQEPKHVSPTYWAVIHIKPNSKEVVSGYVEDDIFYIVFLDKEHHFWPSQNIQNRGKNKR
jgi:hypothetical protein